MEYRRIPKSGEKVSVIGLGVGSLHSSSAGEQERAVRIALDAGVNVMDFIPSEPSGFEGIVRVLRGQRERAMLQVHIGACYGVGAYGWTVELRKAAPEFEARLRSLGTDYADFGFIHCIDEDADFEKVVHGGILDYAIRQKEAGAIRHLAFSTHSARIANRFLDLGIFDWAMFSVNPQYDYTDESQYGRGGTSERHELYQRSEADGVGVATVLPGFRNAEDVQESLAFMEATPEERDYSVIRTFSPMRGEARCVHCNHCQPCPQGIQIGLANKYYDLACQGDELARDHYLTLGARASDCAQCGLCDARCPFGVRQGARMRDILEYFGC